MILLVDVNVVLDVALNRAPFAHDSGKLLTAIDTGRAAGFVAVHTITTASCVVGKNQGKQAARAVLAEILRIFDVASPTRADLSTALSLGWSDFEDAVQAVCAARVGADYIVTRDLHDFRASSVPAHDPAFVLARL